MGMAWAFQETLKPNFTVTDFIQQGDYSSNNTTNFNSAAEYETFKDMSHLVPYLIKQPTSGFTCVL